MFSLDLIDEPPPVGISQRNAERWIKEKLTQLEVSITSAFWNLIDKELDPALSNKISKLMERYKTPTEKLFIARVRKFIKNSIKLMG